MLIEQTEENGDRERWELMGLHLWLQWFVKKKKNYFFQDRSEGVGDKMSNYQKASESTAPW